MNIVWLGFGKMGEPMAARVAAAGHILHVFDISEARRAAACALNLDVVDSLKDAVAGAAKQLDVGHHHVVNFVALSDIEFAVAGQAHLALVSRRQWILAVCS